jgi:uncharacterized protein with PIN domain
LDLMNRIQQAYQVRFQNLLDQVGARRKEKGAKWFSERSQKLSSTENISLPMASERLYATAQHRISHHASRRNPAKANGSNQPVFWCDCGLGGLARWLRATGYEAHWRYHIGDEELLREASDIVAVVLTTDSGLLERRVVRDGVIKTLWLPPALGIEEQLKIVFREFKLARRASRCMSCGGTLEKGDKHQLHHRIPPKTFLWLDEYFVCTRCGKLFWHGTHWRKIHATLQQFPAP